jgi:hypothetical protein
MEEEEEEKKGKTCDTQAHFKLQTGNSHEK